jgi:putative DNA primase/helicase
MNNNTTHHTKTQTKELEISALDYNAAGFATLPVKTNKRPNLKEWACYQKTKPNESVISGWFNGSNPETTGLAIITGKVSDNLEVLDIDCKYDLTNELMQDFCSLVKEHLPELFAKLAIAKTVNKGFHILFRAPAESIQGNKKLAARPATSDEANGGDKVKVLIETRGEGGYIVACPTQGYQWTQGAFTDIPLITAKERETLFAIARSFDQMPVKTAPEEKASNRSSFSELLPFDDYNQRADVPALLEKHGWRFVYQRGENYHYKRPGKTESITSASFHTGLKILYVFSTSTEFEAGRGYNPVQVFTQLEHNRDYSAASRALYAAGYGSRRKEKAETDAPAEFTGEPIPLPEDVLPAPELDENLIPNEWREWLTDIAERMQCPRDYPTVAAIVSAAALIGNKIRIKPKQRDIWQVTANLWGAVVGLPSLLKSPAVNEGMFFFREIEKKERAIYEAKLKEADFDKEFAEAKQSELKKLMRGDKADKEALRNQYQNLAVDEPKEKRLSTADATVEKLGELLNENENGILQIRDELTGWFRSLDRPGRESDRAFYLECWDGAGESKVDRIGRGSIPVKNLTLSIFGTIQPAMLKPFLRGSIDGDTDDGLIQRFQLLVYPNKPKHYTYIDRTPKGRDKARDSFKRLYELDPATIGAKQLDDEFGGGWFVQFDDDAQEFFQTWLSELENDLRSDTFDTAALESHVAKYRSLMPSLALVFHLLDCVSDNQSNAVSLKNAQLAAAWCSYLQAHAARIYQMAVLSEFDIAREILKKIQSKDLNSGFTAKDIYGKHWSKLSKPKDVQNGLDILVEYNYLAPVIINEGHRPKTVYFINAGVK